MLDWAVSVVWLSITRQFEMRVCPQLLYEAHLFAYSREQGGWYLPGVAFVVMA